MYLRAMSSFCRVALSCAVVSSLLAPALAEAKRMPPRPLCFRTDSLPNDLLLHENELELCLAGESGYSDVMSCFKIDLTSAQIRRAPDEGAKRSESKPWKMEVGENEVTICPKSGRDCKTVRATYEVDPGLGLSAELSEDGQRVALAYPENSTIVEVFHVATGKKLMELRGRVKKAMCIAASFAGDVVLVEERDCGVSAISALWLAGPDGKRIADAGGSKAFATSFVPAHLSGDDWAFASAKGDVIAIQDVKTGKVKKKISLGKKSARPPVLVADAKRLVAAYGDKDLGRVVVVDLATYKVKKLEAASCPSYDD